MYFHYFIIISPRKSVWPFIWLNLNSFHTSLVEIGPVVLEKRMKCEKLTDRQTDERQSKNSLELSLRWAKKRNQFVLSLHSDYKKLQHQRKITGIWRVCLNNSSTGIFQLLSQINCLYQNNSLNSSWWLMWVTRPHFLFFSDLNL